MGSEVGLLSRARGLTVHLVRRALLEDLAEALDLPAFARGVLRLGPHIEPVAEPFDLPAFERAVRHTGARHIATLRRWQAADVSPIDIVLADVDRRSVRRLIRGAMQGAPASSRLEGLSATPRLPERMLTELARQPSPSAVVGLLAAAGHPDATALAPLVAGAHPEVFAIDRVLLAGWAARAIDIARRDSLVRELVSLRIDAANVQTALLLAQGPRDLDPASAFVAGGDGLPREAFVAAASATSPGEALTTLRGVLAGTALARLLPVIATDVDAVDRSYLAQALDRADRRTRIDPVSSATLLSTLLRIEAQGRDLRALAWGAALGTPPPQRKALLVTPWA